MIWWELGAVWLQMVGVGHIRKLVKIMKALLWKLILAIVSDLSPPFEGEIFSVQVK